MTISVVELLEFVDVDQAERRPLPQRRMLRNDVAELLLEKAPVPCAGQRIAVRQAVQLIVHRRQPEARFDVGLADQHRARHDGQRNHRTG